MTVAFHNIPVRLEINYARTVDLMNVLRNLEESGAGRVMTVGVRLHITGENADRLLNHIEELFNVGAITDYERKNLLNEVKALKRHFLKSDWGI